MQYDEKLIVERLRVLPEAGKLLFACACAERLMPAYHWFCDQVGIADFPVVRRALDVAWWGGQEALVAPPELPQWRAQLATLVPFVEHQGPHYLAAAIAQHAVAGVVYVLDVWETGDPKRAATVALQLYNAADTLVQQSAPPHTYVANIDVQRPVQLLVDGIYAALQDPLTATALRSMAEADGEQFLKFATAEIPWHH